MLSAVASADAFPDMTTHLVPLGMSWSGRGVNIDRISCTSSVVVCRLSHDTTVLESHRMMSFFESAMAAIGLGKLDLRKGNGYTTNARSTHERRKHLKHWKHWKYWKYEALEALEVLKPYHC